jgi:integrase
MAWLRKVPRSPYWQAIFNLPDGRKTTRSTRTTKKRDAQQIADQFEQASIAGKNSKLTDRQARKTISDIYAIANQDELQSYSTEDYLHNWLERKQLENSELTAERYTSHVDRFLNHLGAKAKQNITLLNSKDISKVLGLVAKELAVTTANTMLKVIRVALKQALRDGFVDINEADRVTFLKVSDKVNRRPFNEREVRRLVKFADFEWQGIILCGFYTGQRLGDIVSLTWENFDAVNGHLIFQTIKTGRSMAIPVAAPLMRYFDELPAGDNPQAPFFPSAYACLMRNNKVAGLSNQFRKIMVKAGLIENKSHQSTGKGRAAKRQVSQFSFHCLRHTTTSMLKNANVSGPIAQDIIGHDSEAISRQYTQIDMTAKRKAIESLPDILN